ncbi:uncharacterized protein [Miscanthus floridulus]|uniref:uncharacterized protein n=1 Tax=Miscanthus floridulus TaxID=154761 RepID=UPI003457508F
MAGGAGPGTRPCNSYDGAPRPDLGGDHLLSSAPHYRRRSSTRKPASQEGRPPSIEIIGTGSPRISQKYSREGHPHPTQLNIARLGPSDPIPSHPIPLYPSNRKLSYSLKSNHPRLVTRPIRRPLSSLPPSRRAPRSCPACLRAIPRRRGRRTLQLRRPPIGQSRSRSSPGAPRTSCGSSARAAARTTAPTPAGHRAAEIFAGHRAAAAGDEAASLLARLADAEADAADLRARTERLEREATDQDELLTALLAATSRAGDSGAGGGPLLRACDGEEEEEWARHDARGDQEQDARGEPLDNAADTTNAEALAAALYAQQRQKHDDDFYTATCTSSTCDCHDH